MFWGRNNYDPKTYPTREDPMARWGGGYCINFAEVLMRRPPPFMKISSGYTGRSKTSFAQANQGRDSTECCTKTKNLAMYSTPNAAALMQ